MCFCSLFLNETAHITMALWVLGIPLLLLYLWLLKMLLTRTSRRGGLVSAGVLGGVAGLSFLMGMGAFLTTVLALSALSGLVGFWLHTPESGT
ncbi:MAG TPA: hypothetical protein VF629_24920 [Hymenobacter sp.]|jgi:hypothetical protein|uniref:hypothetical protein n=1 Tax=Hymenobacter sp. TaxID=1898978 RepID=UPI002ED81A05